MRKLEDKDLVGKTIVAMDNKSANVLWLKFSDGTSAELWAEEGVYTPFGNIPGIFIEDNMEDNMESDIKTDINLNPL